MNTVNKQAFTDALQCQMNGMTGLEAYSYNMGIYHGLNKALEMAQSGRFDSPEMEYVQTYWAREGLIKHQQAEINRLLETLDDIEEELTDDTSPRAQQINRIIQDTISTTTEPTGAEQVKNICDECMGKGT